MNNTTKRSSSTSHSSSGRKINRGYRFAKENVLVSSNAEGEKRYRLGKDQALILERVPKRGYTTLKELREIGKELGITKFHTLKKIEGAVNRNWLIPVQGRRYKLGDGVKRADA